MKKFVCIMFALVIFVTCISCSADNDSIKKGAKGEAVIEIQTLLTEKGYSLVK